MARREMVAAYYWRCQSNFSVMKQKLSDITLSEIFAVGTAFLNTDPALAQHSKNILTKEIESDGYVYWLGVLSLQITMH